LERRKGDLPSVRREVGGFGVVHQARIEALLNVACHDVLNDQRSGLFRARKIRQAIAGGGPRKPRHRDPAATRRDDELEPEVLIEALGEVADDAAVASRDEEDVPLTIAGVPREDRQEIARRRRFVVTRTVLSVRDEIPSVIRRALLVLNAKRSFRYFSNSDRILPA
jgi:hypothetical protein